jgi:hypothetical protein
MVKSSFEFGASLGAAMLDLSQGDLRALRSKTETLESTEGIPFKRALCKIAADAFEADGGERTPPGILFARLSSTADWSPGFDRFADCVKRAMAKQALLPIVAAAHDKLGGGVLKTLVALGALGGAGAGSLAFLLNRNAVQSSAENAALLEKVRAYKQLRREIEEDMGKNDLLNPDAQHA